MFLLALLFTAKLTAIETFSVGKVKVDLVKLKTCSKNILMLPGYNHSRKRMQRETGLLAKAKRRGYCLILPEMKKTIYASQFFAQTRRKALSKPGLRWVIDDLIPAVQSRELLLKTQHNYVLGISTGGRGAAQLAIHRPGLFKAIAAFSGDFDQTLTPKDHLMTAVYGPYKKFTNRWRNIDNLVTQASSVRLPMFLAHGSLDRIVHHSQSSKFYRILKKKQPKLAVKLKLQPSRHSYAFWNSQLAVALNFFDSHR